MEAQKAVTPSPHMSHDPVTEFFPVAPVLAYRLVLFEDLGSLAQYYKQLKALPCGSWCSDVGPQPSAVWLSEYCALDLPAPTTATLGGGGTSGAACPAAEAEDAMVLAHLCLPSPASPVAATYSSPARESDAAAATLGHPLPALRLWLRRLEAVLQWATWASRQG